MAYSKIRPRRDTLENWLAINPILAEGEFVIEAPETGVGTGLIKVKIGDGIKRYNALPYAFDGTAANAIYGGDVYEWHDIYIRTGTTDEWEDVNPILGLGEITYDITEKRFKVGDGTNHWHDLKYIGGIDMNDPLEYEETNEYDNKSEDEVMNIFKPGSTLQQILNAIKSLLKKKATKNHASTTTDYGVGNDTKYGHVKLSDKINGTNAASTGIAASEKAVADVNKKFDAVDTALEGKANKDHASATTDFGKGTADKYGHVRLSDRINGTYGASSGIAASEKAVADVNKKISDLSTSVGNHTHDEYALKGIYNITHVSMGRKAGTTEGSQSFAFGVQVVASTPTAHAEGSYTSATAIGAFATGQNTLASGQYSHAEGSSTTASGAYSHSEGNSVSATGQCSHVEGYLNSAKGDHSHAEGSATKATALRSHAEGHSTTASGDSSHAEGSDCVASGQYSHAEGSGSNASEEISHAEGKNTLASGQCSHAEGDHTSAVGNVSHAEGNGTSARGAYSHSEGFCTTARGFASHAEGNLTLANEQESHAEGQSTTASGIYSHAEGWHTSASGESSHAGGYYTIASNDISTAIGRYNVIMTGGDWGEAFVIGNGSSVSRHNAFSVKFDGTVKAASTITPSTTADYAEYFEWEDGNTTFEDRVGHFVTFSNEDKIRIANSNDEYILGIVSGEPAILSNGDCDTWNGMVMRDKFNRTLYERDTKKEVNTETGELEEVKDKDGNPVYYGMKPVLNPDYNPNEPYVPRSDRPEWAPIGMLGVLTVYQDGSCTINGYCKCNDNGIATKCTNPREGYRVIKVIDNETIKVVFK